MRYKGERGWAGMGCEDGDGSGTKGRIIISQYLPHYHQPIHFKIYMFQPSDSKVFWDGEEVEEVGQKRMSFRDLMQVK